MPVLPRRFYNRPTVEVAQDLLGKLLVHGERAGRIIEVEAYLGANDRAAHAARGLTPSTQVIYGPPGHAYVYQIYGKHHCLNLITEPDGTPGCVLIRAVVPVRGITGETDGPGKLTLAMGITLADNGRDVTRGSLTVRDDGVLPREIDVTPRIGITKCVDWPLRFVAVL